MTEYFTVYVVNEVVIQRYRGRFQRRSFRAGVCLDDESVGFIRIIKDARLFIVSGVVSALVNDGIFDALNGIIDLFL